MKEETREKLRVLGLTVSETTLYLALLDRGLATPTQLAKQSGIQRSNVYPGLTSLVQQGLAKEQKRGKRKLYAASDPKALVRLSKRRTRAIEELLPDLEARQKRTQHKPIVRFYEGWEEVRTIYEQTLQAEQVWAFGHPERLNALESGFVEAYAKKLARNNVVFEDVVTSQSTRAALDQLKVALKGLYSVRVLETQENPPADLLLWGNCVALIVLDEPVYGTVIEQEHIAQLMRLLLLTSSA